MELEEIIDEESDWMLLAQEELYKIEIGEITIEESSIAEVLAELIEDAEEEF